ncbi:MAG: extracellular solute-binding protein [Rhizomicrobium sp.]
MPRRQTALIAALLILTAAGGFYSVRTQHPPVLTVASWAGAYGHAQMSAQMAPFARASGADVRIALYDGGTAELAQQVASGQYKWDVIDMELPDAVAACRAGLLEPRNPPATAPNGTPAADDFIPGALGRCWVGEIAYSRVIGFAPHRFATPPRTLADFFDTARFPGPRALSDTAKDNLEMALLADGVPPDQVYATLTTPAGRARALRKLDSLKGSLVFMAAGDSPARMLNEGRAAFAALLNGDLYDAAQSGSPIDAIWDGQIYGFDVLAIPRGTPRAKLAGDYVRYATTAPVLASLAAWLPYGPARRSAQGHIGLNPELKQSLQAFRPSADGRLQHALPRDEAWWARNGTAAEAEWRAWRARP